MGALAHYLEDEGVPTTGISLVREHTEQMRPPRFLWVPFELGRPLGVPNDAGFQRRVLRAALELLEAPQGPVLVDFPEDAPSDPDNGQAFASPLPLSPPEAGSEHELGVWLQREIEQLAPWYDLAVASRGRTTVGISGLTPGEAGAFLARFLEARLPEAYREGQSLGEAVKLASEDLKAYYQEAITVQPGVRSSRAVTDWFWRETAAGLLLRTLRPLCLQSPDRSLRAIAHRALVPRSQLEKSGSEGGVKRAC